MPDYVESVDPVMSSQPDYREFSEIPMEHLIQPEKSVEKEESLKDEETTEWITAPEVYKQLRVDTKPVSVKPDIVSARSQVTAKQLSQTESDGKVVE